MSCPYAGRLVAGEIAEHAAVAETAFEVDDFDFVAVGIKANEDGAGGFAAVGIDDAESEFAVVAIPGDFAAETDSEVALVAEGDGRFADGFKIGASDGPGLASLEGAVAASVGFDGALRTGWGGGAKGDRFEAGRGLRECGARDAERQQSQSKRMPSVHCDSPVKLSVWCGGQRRWPLSITQNLH